MKKVMFKKRGMTLVEVMLATVVMGIMAIALGAFFQHAAEWRMQSRRMQGALVEATSLMERAFAAVDMTDYDSGTGYLYPDGDMSHATSLNRWKKGHWVFDGNWRLRSQTEFEPVADSVALITVTVWYDVARTQGVVLKAHRYCGE